MPSHSDHIVLSTNLNVNLTDLPQAIPGVEDYMILKGNDLNPLRKKTPKYLFPRGNEPLLYHQIGNKIVFIFITKQ